MNEETQIVCPSCGVPLSSTGPDDTGLCAACAAGDSTPVSARLHDDDTIASDVVPSPSNGSVTEQTMSVGPDTSRGRISGKTKLPGEVPKTIGRFAVKRILGTGGFGTVYKAHDTLLDRVVALKVPRFDSGDRIDDLFLHEAKVAARLRHPNIVAVYETGFAGDQPYIASEYVDGTPLADILSVGRIQVRQVVQIVRQIAEAIDYAHSEGIVHRDLKPGNIMMSKGARPQVMDFGLARLSSDPDASIMREGSIVGTPSFMAPEQARGEKNLIGPKSDQYSVGVLLYAMLCGRPPYKGETWSIVSQVADPAVVPDPPRLVRKSIPKDLEACCLKAMEKDPSRRYDSLNALAHDLKNWLEGRPLLARPIATRERLFRWCARNRLIASLLGVITALILAALVVGYLLAFKFSSLAEYANERADAEKRAKQEVERVLIDTLTESGLDAGRNGRTQEAVLWFGAAAGRATEHPHRESMNRVRFQNWLKHTPVPVRMFRGLGHWHKSLSVHPSGNFVMTEEREPSGDQCQIWDLNSGHKWQCPWGVPISAAAWNHSGNSLALAAGSEVRIFQFPEGQELQRWQHDDFVHQLLFTSDDSRIALGGNRSVAVRMIDDRQGSNSISVPKTVVRLACNPSASRLAVLTDDHLVRVFPGDLTKPDDRVLASPLDCPYESEPPRIGFLSDDLLLVPESREAIHCWDIETGTEAWSVPCGSDANFALAANRERVAIINRDRVIQVDAKTGRQIGSTLVHPNLIYDAKYNTAGSMLLTACSDLFARVYSSETGELLHSMRHGDIVHRVAWVPDRQACVTVHWKADLVRVWKLGDSSRDGFSHPLPGGLMHVEWSADGKHFLPAGMDLMRGAGDHYVLRTEDGTPTAAPIAFPGRASDGCFAGGGNTVILAGSASADEAGEGSHRRRNQDLSRPGLIVGVDFQTGESAFPPIETESNVVAIEASPDGRVVAALCHDRQLLMLDPHSGQLLQRQSTFPDAEFFYGFVIYGRLAFSPDSKQFAVWGSRSRTVEIRSSVDGHLHMKLTHPSQTNLDWIHNVVFSPDGSTIATCSADQTVQLWDAETGQRRPHALHHTGWVFSAAFSEDGKRLLTACQDRQARIWDLDQPNKPVIVTPAQADEVYGVCFLPGETSFLIGLRNGEVSAWDAKQGKMIAPGIVEPDQEAIYSLSVSPDKSRVIVISRDATVRGYHPSHWQAAGESRFSSSELQTLGEIIAAQELHDGVMAGLTNESVLGRWDRLFQSQADHPLFRWSDGDSATRARQQNPSEQTKPE